MVAGRSGVLIGADMGMQQIEHELKADPIKASSDALCILLLWLAV